MTAIVTDSTSDIPSDIAGRLDIHVVPAIMVIDGRSMEDGQGISREELYRQLPGMQTSPTTAAPSSGSFHALYKSLLDNHADEILSIHVASNLSGICNSANVAATSFDSRVYVIDSRQVTMGLGYQVIEAAKCANADHPMEKILQEIENIQRRVHLVALLDTLEYARRSGRISWARSSLSSLFQIKPFLGVKDGTVIRLGETRTRQKGIDRLFAMLADLGPLKDLAILHTNAEVAAVQFLERARSFVKNQPLIVNVTSVIGVHVGPNGLGFVAVTE